jgi:hypothetical protein
MWRRVEGMQTVPLGIQTPDTNINSTDRSDALETVDNTVDSYADTLEAARDQKEDMMSHLASSTVIAVYGRARNVGSDGAVGVEMTRFPFMTLAGAIYGSEENIMPMGPAVEGDTLFLRRGIHRVREAIKLNHSFTARSEVTYAGGGGGGFSGGGGGGYGAGGGGGGGSFVMPGAQNVSINVGFKASKGDLVMVGNKNHGSISIKDLVLSRTWEFESMRDVQEWEV